MCRSLASNRRPYTFSIMLPMHSWLTESSQTALSTFADAFWIIYKNLNIYNGPFACCIHKPCQNATHVRACQHASDIQVFIETNPYLESFLIVVWPSMDPFTRLSNPSRTWLLHALKPFLGKILWVAFPFLPNFDNHPEMIWRVKLTKRQHARVN